MSGVRDTGADLEDLIPLASDHAVELAMKGFELDLSEGVNFSWLAQAVRRALAIARADVTKTSKRPANSDVRSSLLRAADAADAAFLAMSGLDWWSDNELWEASCRSSENHEEIDLGHLGKIRQPAAYRRFQEVTDSLEQIGPWLRSVATGLPCQRGPWKRSADRAVRIDRACCLAPIFETAFGQHVSANGHPSDPRFDRPTAFMDFYQRMVGAAFNEHVTPDLSGVLKRACQNHRVDPVRFGPGIIQLP